jgi:hypothetical protein
VLLLRGTLVVGEKEFVQKSHLWEVGEQLFEKCCIYACGVSPIKSLQLVDHPKREVVHILQELMREDLVRPVIHFPLGRLLKIGIESILTKFGDIRDETGKVSLAE